MPTPGKGSWEYMTDCNVYAGMVGRMINSWLNVIVILWQDSQLVLVVVGSWVVGAR